MFKWFAYFNVLIYNKMFDKQHRTTCVKTRMTRNIRQLHDKLASQFQSHTIVKQYDSDVHNNLVTTTSFFYFVLLQMNVYKYEDLLYKTCHVFSDLNSAKVLTQGCQKNNQTIFFRLILK